MKAPALLWRQSKFVRREPRSSAGPAGRGKTTGVVRGGAHRGPPPSAREKGAAVRRRVRGFLASLGCFEGRAHKAPSFARGILTQ
jgi:hypothetical protein